MSRDKIFDAVEAPVRGIVKYLHQEGFTTTSSCGHEMWVDVTVTDASTLHALTEALWGFLGHDPCVKGINLAYLVAIDPAGVQAPLCRITIEAPKYQIEYLTEEVARLESYEVLTHGEKSELARFRRLLLYVSTEGVY